MNSGYNNRTGELHTIKLLAGSRTYFLNIKQDRKGSFYVVIKESRRTGENTYESHRVMLYEEDFEKFIDGMQQVSDYVKLKKAFSKVS